MAPDLVTFDMGGTSTDIALVTEGEAALGRGRDVAGERIALDSLDIVTLGAGGGSVAHLGPGGTLQVGPRSAGAVPGPACYGAGGTEPTVTDANLVLGYLDPGNFLGGRKTLDREAAERAVAALAERLGLSAVDCAAGIHALVNARMADGVRVATVRRGVDPRDYTLLAFGGAAGLHAGAVASELGLRRAAVPLFAAGLSAWGMLHTDLRYEIARSALDTGGGLPDDTALRAVFDELETEARARVAGWFGGEVSARRGADMRYGEQVFEIAVPLDGLDWNASGLSERVRERLPRPPPRPLHLRPAGRGGGAGQRPGVRGRPTARRRPVRAAARQRARGAGRPPPHPPRRRQAGGSAGLPLRRPRPGPGARRAGHRGKRDHHRAATPRRPGAHGRARLARHRSASSGIAALTSPPGLSTGADPRSVAPRQMREKRPMPTTKLVTFADGKGGVPDHDGEIALAANLHPQHAEPGFGVLEGDPLHQARQASAGSVSTHCSFRPCSVRARSWVCQRTPVLAAYGPRPAACSRRSGSDPGLCLELLARPGYAARGGVSLLVGGLAPLADFRHDGGATGSKGAPESSCCSGSGMSFSRSLRSACLASPSSWGRGAGHRLPPKLRLRAG